MADPVASRSGFLCTYMSNHPDTLVAYVRHCGKVKVPVVSASMTSIDTNGMALSYVEKGAGAATKHVKVPFDPPLSGYDEVKPRLLAMKLDAEEALGMTRSAQIGTFELPPLVLLTGGFISLLIYVTFSVPGSSFPPYDMGPQIRAAVGGYPTLKKIWIGMIAIHIFEGAYTARMCMRQTTKLGVAAKYTVAAALFGFPIILRLRQLIQKARIESISKTD